MDNRFIDPLIPQVPAEEAADQLEPGTLEVDAAGNPTMNYNNELGNNLSVPAPQMPAAPVSPLESSNFQDMQQASGNSVVGTRVDPTAGQTMGQVWNPNTGNRSEQQINQSPVLSSNPVATETAQPSVVQEEPKYAVIDQNTKRAPPQDQRFAAAEKDIKKFQDAQLAGINLAGQAAVGEAAAKSDLLQKQDQFMQGQKLDEDTRVLWAEKQRAEEKQKLDDQLEEIRNTPEVDQQRFWNNMSTGQKFLAAVSVALGGALAGKGENQALKIIENSINRDIDAQKIQRQQKKQVYDAKETLYDKLLVQHKDERSARLATTIAGLEQYKVRLQQVGQQFESKRAQGALKLAWGAAAERQAVLRSELEAKQEEGRSQAGIQNKLYSGKELTPQEADALPDKVRERVVPGFGGTARSASDAREFQKYRAETEPAIATTRRVLTSTGSPEFSRLSPEERAKVSSELVGLMGSLRLTYLGPGAMTEKEYDRLKDAVGDPTKLASLPAWERAKLMTVLNKLETDTAIRAKNIGLVPAGKVQSVSPRE